MFRTTALPTAALLGAPLIVPASATAVGESCQGRPATLVADVIVTNGASRVSALGGDDLICVTGAPIVAPDDARTVVVLAGDGNDRVEATTRGWGTVTMLGSGADHHLGSSDADQEIRTGDFLSVPDVDAGRDGRRPVRRA